MGNYRITVAVTTYLTYDIEAEDGDEAADIARNDTHRTIPHYERTDHDGRRVIGIDPL